MDNKINNLYFLKKYPGLGILCFTNWIKFYQDNFRIYLDEYSEQEKLRKEWFQQNKPSAQQIFQLFKLGKNCKALYINQKSLENKEESEIETDNFFYERFLRKK